MLPTKLVLVALGLALATAAKPDKRLSQLQELSYAEDTLPPLVSANYTKFSAKGPRAYTLVVLFTVREGYNCASCRAAEHELLTAARSYDAVTPKGEQDTFFVSVDYQTAVEAFSLASGSPRGAIEDEHPSHRITVESMSDTSAVPDAAAIIEFAGITTPVPIVRDPAERAHFAKAIAIAAAVLGCIAAVNPSALLFFKHHAFYFCFSLLVYGTSVSGVVYCIIRTPPLYGGGYNGQFSFFDSSGNSQFVLEGLLLGFMNLLAAGGIILAVRAAKSGSPSSAYVTTACLVGIATFIVVYLKIVELYSVKSPWYSPASLVPPGFTMRNARWVARSTVKAATNAYTQLMSA